jgi:hypothetical protein
MTLDKIYLIKELWIDTLTSLGEKDHGWDVVGYVTTEKEAKEIVSIGGGHLNKNKTDNYWDYGKRFDGHPKFKYEEVTQTNIKILEAKEKKKLEDKLARLEAMK